jgi:hypothetical protein
MRQARQCLPYKVTNMTDRWLHYVRDRHHRAQLECITLEMLHSRLSSGESMCQAIKAALQRVTNFHRHALDQRVAEGLSNIEGSGWDETMRLLYDAWEPVLPQCQQKLQTIAGTDKLNPRTISECMYQHGFNAFEALTIDYFG